MGKVHVPQVRVPVQSERLDDHCLEVAREEIREIEGAQFLFRQLVEFFKAGKERVAMGTLDPLCTRFLQHLVEQAAGSAIAIADQDLRIGVPVQQDRAPHLVGDLVWRIVKLCRQAGQVDMIEAVDVSDRYDLARERATGNNEDASDFVVRVLVILDREKRARLPACRQPLQTPSQPLAASWLWRRAIRSLAISTATAASRQ